MEISRPWECNMKHLNVLSMIESLQENSLTIRTIISLNTRTFVRKLY